MCFLKTQSTAYALKGFNQYRFIVKCLIPVLGLVQPQCLLDNVVTICSLFIIVEGLLPSSGSKLSYKKYIDYNYGHFPHVRYASLGLSLFTQINLHNCV